MSRILASLLIVFISAMHFAWASDIHFSAMGDAHHSACAAGGNCDPDETQHAATDPDHCSHGSAHLVGMLSDALRHSLPKLAVTPAAATIYFSVVSAPPTTPPKI